MSKVVIGAILFAIPFVVMSVAAFVEGVNLYGWKIMVAATIGGLIVIGCLGGGLYLMMGE